MSVKEERVQSHQLEDLLITIITQKTKPIGIVIGEAQHRRAIKLFPHSVSTLEKQGITILIDPRVVNDITTAYYDADLWSKRKQAQAIWEDKFKRGPIAVRDGLLYRRIRGNPVIALPEADEVARLHGFQHAEEFVRHLETKAKG